MLRSVSERHELAILDDGEVYIAVTILRRGAYYSLVHYKSNGYDIQEWVDNSDLHWVAGYEDD